MDSKKQKLDIDWDSESQNPTEDARELYQCTEPVNYYAREHINGFADDNEDDYCSSWEYEDDVEAKKEKKRRKK